MYRYLLDGTWMPDDKFTSLYNDYVSTVKDSNFNISFSLNEDFYKALINTFFIRGVMGTEIANLFADNPVPCVRRKLYIIRGNVSICVFQK
jgi:hypothetical protein